MRFLTAGVALALTLMPSFVSAQCVCTCARGRSVPACLPGTLVEPICQQVCTDRVEPPSAGSPSLGGAISPGSVLGGPSPTGAAAASAMGR